MNGLMNSPKEIGESKGGEGEGEGGEGGEYVHLSFYFSPFRRPREFRSVFDEATERVAAHKDSRTVQREMEELRREMEREQVKNKE